MPLKLQYASDLHIEFLANKEFLKQYPLQSVGNVLVLAGDIVPFTLMGKHKDFFSYFADNFQTTYWLPGNHEYYHFDIAEKSGALHEKIRNNVFLVNNTSVVHGDVKLIFSTLWSKISPGHQWYVERSMNDFHVIKHKGDVLNEAFAVELFDLIESSRIACWVYGHHHANIPRFNIGNTQLITNQLGYVHQNEHQFFETNKVIEL